MWSPESVRAYTLSNCEHRPRPRVRAGSCQAAVEPHRSLPLGIVLILPSPIFCCHRPAAQAASASDQLRSTIEVGDEVLTNGGIIGTVTFTRGRSGPPRDRPRRGHPGGPVRHQPVDCPARSRGAAGQEERRIRLGARCGGGAAAAERTAAPDDDAADDDGEHHTQQEPSRRRTETVQGHLIGHDGIDKPRLNGRDHREAATSIGSSGIVPTPRYRAPPRGERSPVAQASSENVDRDHGRRVRPRLVDVFLGNTPKLGLDLQGGVSVNLQPVKDGKVDDSVKPEQLDQAIEIIRRRVDALGRLRARGVPTGQHHPDPDPGRQGPAGGPEAGRARPPSSGSGPCSAETGGDAQGQRQEEGRGRGGQAACGAEASRPASPPAQVAHDEQAKQAPPPRPPRRRPTPPATTTAAPTTTTTRRCREPRPIPPRANGGSQVLARSARIRHDGGASRPVAGRRPRPCRRPRSTSTASTSTTRSSATCTSWSRS